MSGPIELTSIVNLKSSPFRPYLPFQKIFDREQPRMLILKTGRQVSKTTSLSVQHLLQCLTIPHFNILVVNPLESQANRMSTLILRPLINDSPFVKEQLASKPQAFLYQFKTGSNIILSWAFLDVERTRGNPCDKVHIDEVQDVQQKFVPIIAETLSASKWGFMVLSGTPLTLNNTLHYLWTTTNQSEWVIKCRSCNHWNIPSKDHDLDRMIGPYSDDISFENPGTICARCGKKIFPHEGMWVPKFPERKHDIGLHVPQIILPLHYADPMKWSILLRKQKGYLGMTTDMFYREVLGEASDIAERLLSIDDLLSVATLNNRDDIQAVLNMFPAYRLRVFGIDWGGGGEAGNFTTIALVCQTGSGRIEIPWATQLLTPHDHLREAQEIINLANIFKPDYIAHDASVAGSLRETILVHSGYPFERVLPFRYTAMGDIACKFVPPTEMHPRSCYQLDPSRCLLLVCALIKNKTISFFKDDFVDENNPGLLRHFLALVDEAKRRGIGKVYRIVCEPGSNDEFAQASMLGCVAIWTITGSWPKFVF